MHYTKAVREAPTYRTVVTNYQPRPNQLLVSVEKQGLFDVVAWLATMTSYKEREHLYNEETIYSCVRL